MIAPPVVAVFRSAVERIITRLQSVTANFPAATVPDPNASPMAAARLAMFVSAAAQARIQERIAAAEQKMRKLLESLDAKPDFSATEFLNLLAGSAEVENEIQKIAAWAEDLEQQLQKLAVEQN